MTKLIEQKILSKLDNISSRVSKIETFVFQIFKEEDDWLYDPEVVTLLEKRAKLADKEYKEGKCQTAEKVFKELGV